MRDRRVFYVQNTLTDRGRGLVPKFDLSPAREHGRLVELLSPSANPIHENRGIVSELTIKLADYDSEHDSILLIGSPVLIGITVAIAARRSGSVVLLQWDGAARYYIGVKVDGLSDAPPQNEFLKTWVQEKE